MLSLTPQPLGATGLGMVFYMTLQARGEAGPLQVPNVKNALTHNLGLGGSCVVSILRKPDTWKDGSKGKDRLGYDYAAEVRRIGQAELDAVKSREYSAYVKPALGGATLERARL